MDVDFALDVHEHQSACEADGHHHQFGPERPFQDAWGMEQRQRRNVYMSNKDQTALLLHHQKIIPSKGTKSIWIFAQ